MAVRSISKLWPMWVHIMRPANLSWLSRIVKISSTHFEWGLAGKSEGVKKLSSIAISRTSPALSHKSEGQKFSFDLRHRIAVDASYHRFYPASGSTVKLLVCWITLAIIGQVSNFPGQKWNRSKGSAAKWQEIPISSLINASVNIRHGLGSRFHNPTKPTQNLPLVTQPIHTSAFDFNIQFDATQLNLTQSNPARGSTQPNPVIHGE